MVNSNDWRPELVEPYPDKCGEKGRLYKSGGCLMTRCAQHANGRPVEIGPGLDNVRIVERIVGERRNVRSRRCDRATDSFIDIDPASIGLQEE